MSANNGGDAVDALSGGAPVNVMVRNCTVANNGQDGLFTHGTGASIRATRSTITGNGTAWDNEFGGQITSYADNNIEDNDTVNTAPTQIGYK